MTRSEKGYVEYPGTRLYYEVDGDGPALTLIHAGVAHLRMWDAQVAAFKDRYTVVRYDERGFGQTKTDDVPYSNFDDLLHLLDHLAIDRTHLVGNSRGGQIALDFTLANPDRVRSLVLVGAGMSGFDADDPSLTPIFDEMERLWKEKKYDEVVELETQMWTDGPGQPSTRVDPDVRRKMVQWNLENYEAEQEADQIQRLDPPAVGRLGGSQRANVGPVGQAGHVGNQCGEREDGRRDPRRALSDLSGRRPHGLAREAHRVQRAADGFPG